MRELWLHLRDPLAVIGALWVLTLLGLGGLCAWCLLKTGDALYEDEMQDGQEAHDGPRCAPVTVRGEPRCACEFTGGGA